MTNKARNKKGELDTFGAIGLAEGFIEGTKDEQIEAWQKLINDGTCWRLNGSFGRTAAQLIESGDCILGEVGQKDYWGNYIPSRFEVEPGTKGSIEYANAKQAERGE